MKYIFLRLIKDAPANDSNEEAVRAAQEAVESAFQIEWKSKPKPDPKGGLSLSGHIPDDADYQQGLKALKARGYSVGM